MFGPESNRFFPLPRSLGIPYIQNKASEGRFRKGVSNSLCITLTLVVARSGFCR